MQKWEYCELELNIGGPITKTSSKLTFFKADGKHKDYSNQYGIIIAMLGNEGWEMVGSTARIEAGMVAGSHKINYIFKRPAQDSGD